MFRKMRILLSIIAAIGVMGSIQKIVEPLNTRVVEVDVDNNIFIRRA